MEQKGTELMTEEAPRVEVDPEVLKFNRDIQRPRELETLDGQRWRTIMWSLPRVRWFIMGNAFFTIACLVVVMFSYWFREQPQLFVTYPDGTLRCAPQATDQAGRPTPSPREYLATCALFEQRVGGLGGLE